MAEQTRRPPFDPGYKNANGDPNPKRTIDIPALRKGVSMSGMDKHSITQQHPQYQHSDITIPGVPSLDATPTTLALYQVRPTEAGLQQWPSGRPLIYHIHGGGQIAGDRFFGLTIPMSHFPPTANLVFASPEYRLAPEQRAPAGAIDVYAGLVYLVSHAAELHIDPARIVLYGISGGAAVAASAALLSRRERGPRVCALVLDIPMLDDRRDGVVSQEQFREGTLWPGWMDEQAWDAVLGDGDREDVDGVRVAGRAENLGGLPLTFIDVGECESMRDRAVEFASKIWRDGGSAELHVWPGVYHGGAMFEPGVPVGEEMVRVQKSFLERVLGFNADN
ncbi:hypothetical protein EKO04_001491 [Ascochyta lentis]|uniref:Alpha/beta hydrolase fold-3 domain-containing protein n=1 Tax=Ascochyta lentis TaxID=205686 RepID=A0A8H7JBU7_9PLEO|nr:hypothetical protein EKO04_001491 [Ascochyta lentis]